MSEQLRNLILQLKEICEPRPELYSCPIDDNRKLIRSSTCKEWRDRFEFILMVRMLENECR
uniref:Uncharacterized protein n=1 Tax=Romanomermis culicivorax TaxID=13658 RepID=A0A915I2L1_ROMCU